MIKTKGLGGSAKNKITIVFDGFPPPQYNQDSKYTHPIDIIFSRNISADEKIKMIVQESANRKNIAVVSDDKEIKFMTKSLGARHMSAEDFIAPKSRSQGEDKREALKAQLSYTQIHNINQELRKLWLDKR